MSAPARMISDNAVERALDWLRENASTIGRAKERAVLAERMVGHVEALLTKASSASSADARKAEARASERYLRAIHEEAVSAGELAKVYALRDAAQARLDLWRSEQATWRSMKL